MAFPPLFKVGISSFSVILTQFYMGKNVGEGGIDLVEPQMSYVIFFDTI